MSGAPPTAPATGPSDTNTDGPKRPARCLSSILPVNLNDSPASGRGRHATVGVLEPVIRIERSPALDPSPADGGADSGSYRIIASFVLQVAIVGFDQSFQRYNRFFDAVALRYLFCRGDQISLRPASDAAVHGLHVTRERDSSRGIDAGVTAGMVSVAAPQISVQAQRNFKLAYQRTMSSWRTGLSLVEYPSRETPPPLSSLFAAFLIPRSQQLLPRTTDNMARQPPQDLQQPVFRVESPHATACHCHRAYHSAANGCPRWYDRAALWSWQTEAALRLWTPEIYGAFRCPITVAREVPVAVVDALPRGKELDEQALEAYLHFDFEIDVQLRVLGLSWASLLTDAFRRTSRRPAEARLQSDAGQPLPPDRLRFCISCCPDTISWPLYPTRNLQEEAELGTFGPDHVARRLQTNAEFDASLHRPKEPRPARPVTRTASSSIVQPSHTTTWYQDDPLALPAIVPAAALEVRDRSTPAHSGTLNRTASQGHGEACRCQSLGPAQNRRYHCCIDCRAGHAYKAIRREPSFQQTTPLSYPAPPVSLASAESPSTASTRQSGAQPPRPQFRKRTSLEKILHQEKKRRS